MWPRDAELGRFSAESPGRLCRRGARRLVRDVSELEALADRLVDHIRDVVVLPEQSALHRRYAEDGGALCRRPVATLGGIEPVPFFPHAERIQTRRPVYAQDAVEMVDLMLQQFGLVALEIDLVILPGRVLVSNLDPPGSGDPHQEIGE